MLTPAMNITAANRIWTDFEFNRSDIRHVKTFMLYPPHR